MVPIQNFLLQLYGAHVVCVEKLAGASTLCGLYLNLINR